jgi:flagellar protein FliO/FliZ
MSIQSLALAVLSLALVLGLVVLAGRLARAGGLSTRAAGGGTRLALVQTLALDPKRRLLLVRCDRRELLLLTGGGQDAVVGWVDGDTAGLSAGDTP